MIPLLLALILLTFRAFFRASTGPAWYRRPTSKGATRMLRRIVLIGLCAAAACSPQSGQQKKSGPAVAKGNGITVTVDEFKARLDEQSPFIRARYSTLERKKEFLDNLIRFEVLAREAERQGLANDPDVQLTLKKIMVQKLVQKNFQDAPGTQPDLPEAELQKYYDQHRDEYQRPRKVRVAAVVLSAPTGSPERAKKLALAKKALAKLKTEEKKNTLAFAQIVTEFSDDPATKASAGDLQFKTHEELERGYSKQLADTAFQLKPGETSGVVESGQGFYIAKYTGEQPELNRSFDQAKPQIANKLQREKKTKEFDAWLKKLREQARVQVDEKALEGVEVPAAPTQLPPGGPGGPMMMGGPAAHSGGPVPAPAPLPAASPPPSLPRK
jgi:peptidyl-prolyl cis-trans isomerase C